MLSSLAQWAAAVLAIGAVAGLVLAAAAAAGLLWVRRRIRRRLESFMANLARRVIVARAGAVGLGPAPERPLPSRQSWRVC
jgi:hypothetical protein